MTGKIAHLVPDKGFGFIKCDEYESNLFFHVKDLKNASFDDLKKGDDVSFAEIKEGDKGLRALGVSKVV